ncbi:hypothetical protein K4L44_06625 [Halosquirtibacter laminarini]|uniref:Uncharacterized protein n=1 Tax=Halosquirtibacter laminarini TaxID=3374600 RepID=A0AC61NIF9_9BACT|nr:hypothetical protein K4L44_06625 [Prolixibacteraceae bacterium]
MKYLFLISTQDTLQHVVKNVSDSATTESTIFGNIWFWVSIIEAVVILLLWMKKRHPSALEKKKEEILNEAVDFDNVMRSSFQSSERLDRLKRKCHPDRFVSDPEKQAHAERIFQAVIEGKDDYKKLKALEEEASQYL